MYLLFSDLLDTSQFPRWYITVIVSQSKAASSHKNPPTAGSSYDASGLKDTIKETPVYSARRMIRLIKWKWK